jgi:hypothetical protein
LDKESKMTMEGERTGCEKKIKMQDDNFQVFLGAGKKKCSSE